MGAPGTLGKLLACEPAPPSIDGATVGLQVTQEFLVPPVRKVPGGGALGARRAPRFPVLNGP